MSDGLALLHRHLNGETLDDAQREALSQWVCESPENARLVAELTNLDRTIAADLRSQAGVPLVGVSEAELIDETGDSYTNEIMQAVAKRASQQLEVPDERPSGRDAPRHKFTKSDAAWAAGKLFKHLVLSRPAPYIMAAAVLLGVVLAIALLTGGPDDAERIAETPGHPGPMDERVEEQQVVATLTEAIEASWEGATLTVGDSLLNEQPIKLIHGYAKLRFENQAEVILDAPCEIVPVSDSVMRITHGKVIGRCYTDSSKGFIVNTPNGVVTDLGTEFSVDVKDHETTDVQVLTGKVVVTLNDGSGEAVQAKVLEAGSAARLASDLQQIRQGLARPEDFVFATLDPSPAPGIITDDFEHVDTSQPGGFDPDGGTGWAGPWQTQASRVPDLRIENADDAPLGWDSERYLEFRLRHTAGASFASLTRQYDRFGGVDRGKPHRIRFLVRVHDGFGPSDTFRDRISIFDDPDLRTGTLGSNTWMITAFGFPAYHNTSQDGTGTLTVAPWSWSFYDGDAKSIANDKADFSRILDTGVQIVPGETYSFEVTVMPERSQWDLVIRHGGERYSSRDAMGRPLGFRSSAKQAGGFLHFNLSTNRPNAEARIQIDDVRIEPLD